MDLGFHKWISGAPVLVIACTSEAAYHSRYQEPDKIQPDGTEIGWSVPQLQTNRIYGPQGYGDT